MMKAFVEEWFAAQGERFCRLSETLWKHPELSEKEYESSAALIRVMEEEGFSVSAGTAGLPTAFTASFGEGSPRIGILAEYDALPGLSQQVGIRKQPVENQACGHGCGHNLLGTAAAAAAIAIKDKMKEQGLPGTVILYGCPSEEIMMGKIVMAKEHVFDKLDMVLSWHPGNYNSASEMSYQAMLSLDYHFHGRASHASMAPQEGLSALDGVELMNVGANYLREHMPPGGQLHYVITNGGEKPNIVPQEASVWYFIRANSKADVKTIRGRLDQIARGAALMTGTHVSVSERTGCSETRIVPAMVTLLYQCMKEVDAQKWTREEEEFSLELLKNSQIDVEQLEARDRYFTKEHPLCSDLMPLEGKTIDILGSSDLSDVSWIVPTGMVFTSCYPVGMPNHTWGVTSCSGMSIGQKGMLYAAKTMALAGLYLMTSEELRKKITESFQQAMGKDSYAPTVESCEEKEL